MMRRLTFLVLMSSLAFGQNLQHEFDSIMKPTIGAAIKLPNKVKIGGLELTLSAETKAWQLLAGSEPCGIVFEGDDVMRFTINDKFAAPLAKRNVKSARPRLAETMNVSDNSASVRDGLKRGIIWTWEYARIPATQGEAAPVDLQKWVDDVTNSLYNAVPGIELINARYNQVRGVAVGIFRANTGNYLFSHDPIHTMEQNLMLIEKITRSDRTTDKTLLGKWTDYRLMSAPIGRNWWDRFPAPLVSVYTKLDVNNTMGDAVEVRSDLTLKATLDNQSLWRVQLMDGRRYQDKTRPNRVSRVTVGDQEVPYLHTDNELLVLLGKKLMRGETIDVHVETAGELAIHEGGDKYWQLGTMPWYPQGWLNGEYTEFEITLRVPKPYTPFASGNRIELTGDDTHNILRTKYNKPMQFPVVAAGEYNVNTEEKNGFKCNIATYIHKRERSAKRLQTNFFAAADYFNRLFGTPYPFEELTVIERNTFGFGQAPPGIIFLTQEAFESRGDTRAEITSQGVNSRYVHEIAHAWWAHVVKMDSFNEQWLTESFADYSAELCMQAMYGKKRGKAEFKKAVSNWKANAERAGEGSIYLANYLSFYGSNGDGRTRYFLLYNKGPYLLHAIRGELQQKYGVKDGDDKFFTLLRSFVTNFKFKWGATRHFVGILNQITGDDWQPYFEKYVYGSEMPVAKVKI